MPGSGRVTATVRDDVVDAVIGASRVLVAVAARSLGDVTAEVTLPQFRALVVLASQGPQRPALLADALGVSPSTVTRMCDRLVRKRLVRRTRPPDDRRIVVVDLTDSGRELVAAVTRRRRLDVTRILKHMSAEDRAGVVHALRSFNAAAGEVPEREWSTGWRE